MGNLFIGGDVMDDAMQEVREKCSAKSASVEYLKHDTAEDMPDALKAYVRDRNNMDLASIVVTLMPSRSTAQFKSEVQKSIATSIHACAVILDDHCKQKHQPHLKDEHACQVKVLTPVKTPLLSLPEKLITQT